MRRSLLGTYQNYDNGHEGNVWFCLVESVLELERHIKSAVASYKEVFSGPPYFENYDGKEESFIVPMFNDYAERGILVLAMFGENTTEARVIGFGASIDADKSEAAGFLRDKKGFEKLDDFLYMAELGVESPFRNQGLGTQLVVARINEAKTNPRFNFTHVIMRTAAVGSNSKRIYERLGAKHVEGLVELKEDFGTQSSERIFLRMPIL